ncbi:hypothetical protein [Actinoplanes sp. NPDC049265]|uniref:hypothetical protein n=1 Tax=Actinoplanes sp. NPDC049265 TaxID=3363902 RepID=UPI003720DDA8
MDSEMDSERRPLRSIGTSASEIHARTGQLLAGLAGARGARLITAVPVGAGETPIPYAFCAGRSIVLLDSVAWPAGTYAITPDGRVLCDGTYIGQSIRQLVGAVHRLRGAISGERRVEAVVVVHPCTPTAPTLPVTGPPGLSWVTPADLGAHLGARTNPARLLSV